MSLRIEMSWKCKASDPDPYALEKIVQAFGGILDKRHTCLRQKNFSQFCGVLSTKNVDHETTILLACALYNHCILLTPSRCSRSYWHQNDPYQKPHVAFCKYINAELDHIVSGIINHDLVQTLAVEEGEVSKILHLWLLELNPIVKAFPGYLEMVQNNMRLKHNHQDWNVDQIEKMRRVANIRALRLFPAWLRPYERNNSLMSKPSSYIPLIEVNSLFQWLERITRQSSVPSAVGALIGIELATNLWCSKVLPDLRRYYEAKGFRNVDTLVSWVSSHAKLASRYGRCSDEIGYLVTNICSTESDVRDALLGAMLALFYYRRGMDSFIATHAYRADWL